jgi:hypothetical protein
MLDSIQKVMSNLPVLKGRKEPTLALILGLVAGGIGLALYFWSFVDLVIPVGIAIACTLLFGDAGLLGGAIIAGLYGYFRTIDSNSRLEAGTAPAGAAVQP